MMGIGHVWMRFWEMSRDKDSWGRGTKEKIRLGIRAYENICQMQKPQFLSRST